MVTECNIFFQRASEHGRHHGYPRIYISANSGPRIGLADEVKHLFKVAWEDPTDPDKVHCITKLNCQ